MPRTGSRLCSSFLVVMAVASAQLQQQQVRFDAASIREIPNPAAVDRVVRDRVETTPESVTMRNASLSFCVQWAYDLKFYQVSGPEWMKELRYEILAKTDEPRSLPEMRARMRAVLADRFKMEARFESSVRPVYALIVALRKGSAGQSKLKLNKADSDQKPQMMVIDGSFVFQGVTMTHFAEQLSDFATVDRPVVDQTRLDGAYSFKLDAAARAMRTGEGPTIFTAVSEIGLQMKPAREPIKVLVVQSVERRPTSN